MVDEDLHDSRLFLKEVKEMNLVINALVGTLNVALVKFKGVDTRQEQF